MHDLIYRQAAIDAIREISPELFSAYQHNTYIDKQGAMIRIMALPPAQSEIIRCKDCKYWKQQTNYQHVPLLFGFCENDYMYIDTNDDFYCGYAERKNND